MKSSAVTPLFRAFRCFAVPPAGDTHHPASVPGQCQAESLVMAVLTLGVFLTLSLDLTAFIRVSWLRWPCAAVLCFLLPHGSMMGIAALIPPSGPIPSLRQAWIFLSLLTVYAVLRVTLGPASDFAEVTCTAWLILTAANLLALPFAPRL